MMTWASAPRHPFGLVNGAGCRDTAPSFQAGGDDSAVISGAKRRLIVALALLLGVGFLVTTIGSYLVSSASIRQGIVETELPLTSDTIYSEIQNDLIRPVLISSVMASDTFLQDWVREGEEPLSAIAAYLGEIRRRYNTVASFFVSDATRRYYYADGVLKPIDHADWRDAWYFRVRDMEAAYEINVDPDFANQDALTIFVNYRVLAADGHFLGVAGVGLTVNAVRDLIRSYQSRFHRVVYFVDPGGKIVLTSDQSAVPEAMLAQREGLAEVAARLDMAGAGAGSLSYRRQGHETLLNIRFIPQLNWYLFVEKTEDEALGPARQTLYLNLALCAIVTALVLWAVLATINRYQARLEVMATTDKLTGLASRHAYDTVIARAVTEAHRGGSPLSAVLVDIDEFKAVNDGFGHLAGDRVIVEVASAIRRALRTRDIVCRWGGDEYLAVLPGCSLAEAARLAERIREAVATATGAIDDGSLTVTVSLGVAALEPRDIVDDLLSRVDRALYAAKAGGRDRLAVASDA